MVTKFVELSDLSRSAIAKAVDISSKTQHTVLILMAIAVAVLVIALILGGLLHNGAFFVCGFVILIGLGITGLYIDNSGRDEQKVVKAEYNKVASEISVEIADLIIENQDSITVVKDGYSYTVTIDGEEYSLYLGEESKFLKYSSTDKKWHLADMK